MSGESLLESEDGEDLKEELEPESRYMVRTGNSNSDEGDTDKQPKFEVGSLSRSVTNHRSSKDLIDIDTYDIVLGISVATPLAGMMTYMGLTVLFPEYADTAGDFVHDWTNHPSMAAENTVDAAVDIIEYVGESSYEIGEDMYDRLKDSLD